MKKKAVLYILLDLVFLIVFNAVFFLLGGAEHKTSVWLSYGFIHFAYLLVLLTPVLCGRRGKDTVMRMPIYTVSACYFFAAFIAGLVFIFLKPNQIKISLVIQIVIAGIYAAVLLVNLIANADTEEQAKRQEEEVRYIKNSAARVKLLIGRLEDKKADKAVEKAFDALNSSPTRTTEELFLLETAISDQISYLESAVKLGDSENVIKISGSIVSLVEERNVKLKNGTA